jgi:hypothetical protein
VLKADKKAIFIAASKASEAATFLAALQPTNRNAGMRCAVPAVIYKDHRGNRLPSVTTIIGRFKESGGLLYWANQQGLEGKTLDQARAEVTTPGTLAVEDHINGRPETALTAAGEVTEKARNAYAAYLHWEAINRITFRHTEVSLASETHAFGGTLDAVGMVGNALILLDWKCANAVYADYLYQLAAYGLLWNENYPGHPLVGGFHLCRFAKEQGDFSHHYFPSLDAEAETFLRMRDLFDRVKKAERRLR